MFEKLRLKVKSLSKEKTAMIAIVVASVIVTLWIASHDTKPDQNPDLELTIPKGFLIVPLELANAASLSSLVAKAAVVDVFQPGEKTAVVENVRIIKLDAGEGPLFGALVPEKLAGQLQDLFSRPKLKAALRTMNAGPVVIHAVNREKPLLIEVPTGD